MGVTTKERSVIASIDKIQPQLENSLRKSWEKLFWEPQITPMGRGRFTVNGYTIDSDYDTSTGDSVFVSAEGKLFQTKGGRIKEGDLSTYLEYAAKAEIALAKLRVDQLREIDEAPDGRDILWRPGTNMEFTGFYYSDEKPYGENIPETKTLSVHVRNFGPPHGTALRMPYQVYCPEHPKNGRLTLTSFPEDRNRLFVACEFNDLWDRGVISLSGHFAIYSGTRVDGVSV